MYIYTYIYTSSFTTKHLPGFAIKPWAFPLLLISVDKGFWGQSHPSVNSALSYISLQPGRMKASMHVLQDCVKPAYFITEQCKTLRGKLSFHAVILELTDAHDWLVLVWLTEERKYTIPPTQSFALAVVSLVKCFHSSEFYIDKWYKQLYVLLPL